MERLRGEVAYGRRDGLTDPPHEREVAGRKGVRGLVVMEADPSLLGLRRLHTPFI